MSLGKTILVAALAAILVIVPLASDMGLFDPKPERDPSAELSAFLIWQAYGDLLGGEGGSISISGDITNHGDEEGWGTVHLRVFDGYEWKDHYKDTGIVPADGSVPFSMNISLDRVIINSAEVLVSIQ